MGSLCQYFANTRTRDKCTEAGCSRHKNTEPSDTDILMSLETTVEQSGLDRKTKKCLYEGIR